jgi:hypothetical protein
MYSVTPYFFKTHLIQFFNPIQYFVGDLNCSYILSEMLHAFFSYPMRSLCP